MRIALIGYLHGNGGAERQITMLANSLTPTHEVFFIITGANNERYPISVDVHKVDITGKEQGKLAIIRRYYALRKVLLAIKPEVTIHYNLQSAYFSVTYPQKARGKIIYSERGDPYDDEYSGLLGVIRKYAIKRIDGFVFQTEGARDFFDEYIRNRSTVIHNPLSISPTKQKFPVVRDKRIVSVGRLHPQKNQRLLINAFAKIAPDFTDYSLEIYGDGPLKEDLEKLIEEKDLKGQVQLLNARKDIFNAIKNAAMFVLSSDYEGMPNALMEAMALGMPCISTDCRPGGARALIKNGENGIIVPCGNETTLAEKMAYLLKNPEVAKNYGEKATHIAESHTPDAIFKQWEDYIERISKQ